MKVIGFILYRYLLLSWISKKKHRQGSSIAILIPVLGVAVGVFAFTVVVSVMSGFVQNIKLSMLHFEPHIVVSSLIRGEQILNSQTTIDQIKQIDPNILSLTPFQKTDVILQSGNKAVIANLQGVDSQLKKQPTDIETYLNRGTTISDLNKNKASRSIENSSLFPTVILGVDLMDQLDLRIGDTVTLVSPLLDEGPGGLSPTQLPVVITGYLNSGNFSFDKKIILSSLETANLFLQYDSTIQGYDLTIKEPMEADSISKKLNKKLSVLKLKATPWTENNKSLLKALTLEHYGMIFVLIMIILVGCFSITISLLLSIRRKSKEMAILRSMGFKQIDLSKLYLWQGFIIGLSGIIIGLIFGFITLYLIHNYRIPFITSSYSSDPLPILVDCKDIAIVIFGSFILSMIAAVWPAYEVKNLNIIEILSIRN